MSSYLKVELVIKNASGFLQINDDPVALMKIITGPEGILLSGIEAGQVRSVVSSIVTAKQMVPANSDK